ncbi:CHAP domain-containing protein [Tengunoibacter tsumagoiensis]|uniref:Peptidase C51 domain-containing protein n=1 Tax=Tengunoibacter tsumagoiensis TaxID=2014871 RepID=A0A402A0C8_9CHLR|nr:CHAP domain-containing protein [Tengunoibacter tsumagoiensis]GCE12519.1 hypothetical protein KTT_23780 [Tengunoibacter tsumagoiensis]
MLRFIGFLVAASLIPVVLIVVLVAILLSALGSGLESTGTGGLTGTPLLFTACPTARSTACTSSQKMTAVAQAAALLQDHTWGIRANMYDRFDPVVAPVYRFWINTCGTGHQICDEAASGNLQCVEFVTGAFYLAGDDLPAVGNGIDFWPLYQHLDGWTEIPVGTGWPHPGDMMVWSGGDFGHVAVVTETVLPVDGKTGSVTVAQANAPGTRWDAAHADQPGNWYRMLLHADGSISTWPGYTVLGFVRQTTSSSVS